MLTEILKARNMSVEAPSFLSGRSGVKHQFDVMVGTATGASIMVDIECSQHEVDEFAVLRCFAKGFDANPRRLVLIAHPKLKAEAAKLADIYKIRTIEADGPHRIHDIAGMLHAFLQEA